MTVYRRASGAWTSVNPVKVRSAGVWVNKSSLRVRSGGAWVEKLVVPTPIALSHTGPVYDSGRLATITSYAASVDASGGSGAAKTFTWDFTSNPGGITALTPGSSTTQFRKTNAAIGNTYDAIARCTVSDGTYSASVSFDVALTRNEIEA